MNPVIIIDPGHGMGNRRAGRYDSGATAGGFEEAGVVLEWANELRGLLRARGIAVVRTRVSPTDPCPVSGRAEIARRYNGSLMLSLHCNSADGKASGTETFYRGSDRKPLAMKINKAVADSLGTINRGIKPESESQHARLAVMSFQPCFLVELGFIDHSGDRGKITSGELRKKACQALSECLIDHFR